MKQEVESLDANGTARRKVLTVAATAVAAAAASPLFSPLTAIAADLLPTFSTLTV